MSEIQLMPRHRHLETYFWKGGAQSMGEKARNEFNFYVQDVAQLVSQNIQDI